MDIYDEHISLITKNNFKYRVITEIDDVTFKGGQKESVHSWFRLTPSYSPEFVRYYIKEYNISETDILFDPFLGAATTAIEAKKNNLSFIGIELNPFLKKVDEYRLDWEYCINDLKKESSNLIEQFTELKAKTEKSSLDDVLVKYDLEIPKIYNPMRWWREYVLKDLLLLKMLVNSFSTKNKKVFWIALSTSSLDCANIHRNHPTISFDDDHQRDINVLEDFKSRINKIIDDLEELQSNKNLNLDKTTIINGDSTEINKYLDKNIKVDYLITSPPYPNRFSYIHTTRPQLFFMDIIDNAKEATELDLKAIGGTWGRATSILEKEFISPNVGIEPFLEYYIKDLKEESLLMCNYATKYFNMMHNHIKSLKMVANKGKFKGTYLVGNSRLKGVEIYTEIILAQIFELEGFKIESIDIFRKRGGKKKLFESSVSISY